MVCRWSRSVSATSGPAKSAVLRKPEAWTVLRSVEFCRFASRTVVQRGTALRGSRTSQATPESSFAQLNKGIASFYDASTGLWEEMWGDHLHHGYYSADADQPTRKSNREAQEEMIERVLEWAGITQFTDGQRMVDVGCGLGGSSRHIIRKFGGGSAQGVTLSPYQAQRGNELSAAAGLKDYVQLQVADALHQPFDDDTFDLVWSLESGEHMPDKRKFVGELARVCAPGGRVIIVTWCHRVLHATEPSLKEDEQRLLDEICDAYYLPQWCSIADYERLFVENGFDDVRTADWSEQVAPFWGEVIKSALTFRGVLGLLRSGWTTIRGALVMPLMAQGLQRGVVRFALITGVKRKVNEL
jgi:tocopherol O-methyltransferase